MTISIIDNNPTAPGIVQDRILIYYQSTSSRGPQFSIVDDYDKYLLNYDADEKVKYLLSLNEKFILFIHRITLIENNSESSVYILPSGDGVDFYNIATKTIKDLYFTSDTIYEDDFFMLLDFISYNKEQKVSYYNTPFIIGKSGAKNLRDWDKITSKQYYKFIDSSDTKVICDTLYSLLTADKRMDKKLFNEGSFIRLIDNSGIISNYPTHFEIKNIDNKNIITKQDYVLKYYNKTNQDIGIILHYDEFSSYYTIIVKLYYGDKLLKTETSRVKKLEGFESDLLSIELGSISLDENIDLIDGKEYRVFRRESYYDTSRYVTALSELEEINTTFDIALDPTTTELWGNSLLIYKSTPLILTNNNIFNNYNVAIFTPREIKIEDGELVLPSYYLFLDMYPERYTERVNEISLVGTEYKNKVKNLVHITATDYGYEINNPTTYRALNSMIEICQIARKLTNTSFYSMNELLEKARELGCTVLSYTNSIAHIQIIVDDIKRELNLEVVKPQGDDNE